MSRASFTQPGGLRRVRPKQRPPALPITEREACERLEHKLYCEYFDSEQGSLLEWAARHEWTAALLRTHDANA